MIGVREFVTSVSSHNASALGDTIAFLQQSSVWLRVAEKIKDQYSLAAYSIAAIMAIVGVIKRDKLLRKPFLLVIIVIAVVVSASLPAISNYALKRLTVNSETAYRITVSVVNSDGSTTRNPLVDTDIPSHAYQIGDSIQVEIAETHIPADRKITLKAKDASGLVEAQKEIELGEDRNPRVTVTLEPKPSAIRGNVLDVNGSGVEGATVSVLGYKESVVTSQGGLFIIDTHAPSGEAVTLLVEKPGFKSERQQHIAGPTPATIVLAKTRRTH